MMTSPMPRAVVVPPQLPDEMTVREVARRMGYHTNSIYKMCEDGVLPHDRPHPRARIKFSRELMARRFPNSRWYD